MRGRQGCRHRGREDCVMLLLCSLAKAGDCHVATLSVIGAHFRVQVVEQEKDRTEPDQPLLQESDIPIAQLLNSTGLFLLKLMQCISVFENFSPEMAESGWSNNSMIEGMDVTPQSEVSMFGTHNGMKQ